MGDNNSKLAELFSDAKYYSDCAGIGWDFPGKLGMQSSARATVKAIEKHISHLSFLDAKDRYRG